MQVMHFVVQVIRRLQPNGRGRLHANPRSIERQFPDLSPRVADRSLL